MSIEVVHIVKLWYFIAVIMVISKMCVEGEECKISLILEKVDYVQY